MSISEVVPEKEVDVSPVEEIPQEDDITPSFDPPKVELLIFL
jgi:hypothetical protein